MPRTAVFAAAVAVMSSFAAHAVTPQGIVFESESICTPADAWQQDTRQGDLWMLWTKEEDIDAKRSGGAVLASPHVEADRATPEDGAPPLHAVVTGLEPGAYCVYVSAPGARPLAYSTDGTEWVRHSGGELLLGVRDLPEGRFELWVDDRYAYPAGNPGPGYFDYLRFVRVADGAEKVDRVPYLPDTLEALRKADCVTVVDAENLEDLQGFELDGNVLKGGSKAGANFRHTFDQAGTFYLGVVMNDDGDGIEQLQATFKGEHVGCIVGGDPKDAIWLYRFSDPVTVQGGDSVAFTALHGVGFYRVRALVLSTSPVTPPPPRIENVAVWSPESGAVDLCWTTSVIAPTGRVECRGEDGKPMVIESDYSGRNHRAQLRGLNPHAKYEATVITAFNGEEVSAPMVFTAAPPVPAPTQPFALDLAVPEPTNRPRSDWPATIGVPFAQGQLARVADLRLFDRDGNAVPLQSRTFSRWRDGSVKWAVLSFVTDAPASLKLEARPAWDTPAPDAAPVLTLTDAGDAWDVRTDAIAFRLGKSTPALFDRVAYDRNGDGTVAADEAIAADPIGANVKLELPDGTFLTCGPPANGELVVEQNGPARAILRWAGTMQSDAGPAPWDYLVRVTLAKSLPTLDISLSMAYVGTDPAYTPINKLALRVPVEGNGGVRGALEGDALQAVSEGAPLEILQDYDDHFALTAPAGAREGTRATGLAVAEDDAVSVNVLVRDFWQTYPSGYAIRPDGIHVRLLPELPADAYRGEADRDWFFKIYAWCKDGDYLFKSGQMTQQRLCVTYAAPGAIDAAQHTQWLANPLVPQLEPAYLCGTGALGAPIFPRTEGVWDSYEEWFAKGFEALEKNRETCRTFGWMHYGDWFGERILNHGNNEYDLPWALGLQWMRTGERGYFDRGLQMARHHSTVDTLHGDAAWAGRALVWEHSLNHVGSGLSVEEMNIPPDNPDGKKYLENFGSMFGGALDPQGHVFNPGNWLYAALTGDPWFADAAARVADHQAEKLTPAYNFTIERSGGWPLINASNAYAFSGNPYYLNAARLMIERTLARQDPDTGGWLHNPPINETEGQRVLGGKAFAVGILSHGIMRYLEQEPEPRPDVRHMLVRGADWLMNESWIPGKGFRYITNAPNYRDTGARGLTCQLVAEHVAWAYDETGDQKYLDFWKEVTAGMFDSPLNGMGKAFTQGTRQTVYALDRARKWGVNEVEPLK